MSITSDFTYDIGSSTVYCRIYWRKLLMFNPDVVSNAKMKRGEKEIK